MRHLPTFLALAVLIIAAGTAQAGDSTVAVLYFDNNSGQSQYDTLGKGLADMLITDLTNAGGLQVVEREKLEKLLEELKLQRGKYFDPETALRLGRQTGAQLALTGAFYISGGEMRIDTRVVDVATGKILAAEKVAGPVERFFDLQARLAELFVQNLSERLSEKDQKAVLTQARASRAKDLASFAVYSTALDLADQGKLKEASEKMGQAVKEDPDFSLARSRQAELMEKIYQDTQEIKGSTQRIEAQNKALAETMGKIAQGFEALSKQGGLIPNPTTPEAYYHNARFSELGGDYGRARRDYLEYFKFDLDFVDPHLRFLTFLKVQEGREGAREVYEYIRGRAKSFVPDFAAALLWNKDRRIPALEKIIREHPDFAPAYFELSKDYSETRVGRQTLEDKKQEKALLDKFVELDRSGNLVRYFLDQQVVAEMRQDAEDRLAALKLFDLKASKSPVTVSWMKTNGGWIGAVIIAEAVLDILVRMPGEDDFKNLGHQDYVSQQTGRPIPSQTISLPFTDHPVSVFVKYTDVQGHERGPFEVLLDPGLAELKATKRIFDLSRNSWIVFKNNLAYFTFMMSYRGALKEIRYGLDTDHPDKIYKFPAFNGPGVATIGQNVPIYIKIPQSTRYMTVQVTFKDGEESEILRFDRK